MLVLIGPSASGKTESAKIMINRYPISRVVTCTTRKKRINEIDGFDYHFLSKTRFLQLKKDGDFLETAVYNNNFYGTPKNEIADDKFIILEPQGLKSFLAQSDCQIVAIFLKTKEVTRINRMKLRKDIPEDIKKRIKADREEFNLKKIEGLDLIIDTNEVTLSELADKIYFSYLEILEKKKLSGKQLSLF
ncbi:MAG: guanylate kinase [Candidatus Izemoplasmatales bacterium]|nr:guanylate kinase [Candidatus Izemoplasmatales bacterium]